jgi:GTPase SAR1 family protein
VYDVGGQKNEREKWQRISDEVAGVIFCVSFDDFDKPMFEHLPQHVARIKDAMEIFADLTHKPKFAEAPFFFIGNKIDSFNSKVKNTDCFRRVFPDFAGDVHSPDECAKYLQRQFIERAMPELPKRPITCLLQDSLKVADVTGNVEQMCQFIRTHYPL